MMKIFSLCKMYLYEGKVTIVQIKSPMPAMATMDFCEKGDVP